MSYINWMNKCVKKLDWKDIGLVKLSVAGFILMVAKLWSGILALDWYWYLVIALVAAIRPMKKMF